jgi:hypothetical protein
MYVQLNTAAHLHNSFAAELQRILCFFVVVALRVTVNYIQILDLSQKLFYGKFMSPAKMRIIYASF